ncbi:hypothetical protein KZY98_12460 [Croceibacter atlanticus]|uniref:hypothetical protein n=1 Tax=Croceibacter atlanticus TaxID=313588 RepID=UPI001C5FDAC3|nr:hypothetical protein [Croceibacter atlanticus]MBW4971276.1 hypothetical protein [Croceibacter atlanticus]
MKKKLKQSVITAIMDRAVEINKACKEQCRDFEIMLSRKRENSLILRWISIDISNEDNPVQQYRYECFQTDGTSQLCSVHYADQEEANEFIWSLEPLYHQQFAIDHKL